MSRINSQGTIHLNAFKSPRLRQDLLTRSHPLAIALSKTPQRIFYTILFQVFPRLFFSYKMGKAAGKFLKVLTFEVLMKSLLNTMGKIKIKVFLKHGFLSSNTLLADNFFFFSICDKICFSSARTIRIGRGGKNQTQTKPCQNQSKQIQKKH